MQTTTGVYYPANRSDAQAASLHITRTQLTITTDAVNVERFELTEIKVASAIPGTPLEFRTQSGGLFIVDDPTFRFQTSNFSLEALEKNTFLILIGTVLTPVFLWLLITIWVPAIAAKSVNYIPDTVPTEMGEQAFTILEKSFLSETTLTLDKQQVVKAIWIRLLSDIDTEHHDYQLHLAQSDVFGANALALPNGQIVVTDQLIEQLEKHTENPEGALIAILLHEIGHVEHQHSLTLVAQSVSTAIVFAMIFNDLEGIGEVLIGTSSSLLQNAFSRDMETQADAYALKKLTELNKPTSLFADAMKSFHQGEDIEDEMSYLSSHPATSERIKQALNYMENKP